MKVEEGPFLYRLISSLIENSKTPHFCVLFMKLWRMDLLVSISFELYVKEK